MFEIIHRLTAFKECYEHSVQVIRNPTGSNVSNPVRLVISAPLWRRRLFVAGLLFTLVLVCAP